MRNACRLLYWLLLVTVAMGWVGRSQAGEKRFVAYYTAWSIYARSYYVDKIPATHLTHINYAFANISAGGECVLGDPWADVEKAFTGDSWDSPLRGNFNQLKLLKKKHPHLKTLISIGGWTWSARFSDVALTDASRKKFAKSCVAFMSKYGFDGVDVDWEYPVRGGMPSNKTRPADRANYTLLLAELRRQLNELGSQTGRKYLLTIAAPAGPSTYVNLELSKIHPYLDWINLMTYDFAGGWSSKTNFNAPLYPPAEDAALGLSAHSAVQAYLKAGVPEKKLVMGVPFYGRGWKGVGGGEHGLRSSHSGVPMGTWENGMFDYKDLKANYLGSGYTRHWHATAKVPWLYHPAKKIMISYDDTTSLAAKADYVVKNRLGGVMAWELSCDDSGNSLVKAISKILKAGEGGDSGGTGGPDPEKEKSPEPPKEDPEKEESPEPPEEDPKKEESPEPPKSGKAVEIAFEETAAWGAGFSGLIRVKNLSKKPLDGWNFQFRSAFEIKSLWNAQLKKAGTLYQVGHLSWNRVIPAGGEVLVGFTASGTFEAPSEVSINGGDVDVKSPEPEKTTWEGKDVTVTFKKASDWGTGYTAQMTISNRSKTTIAGWVVRFEMASAISSLWNGVWSHQAASHQVKDAGWNTKIGPGQTITVGFWGSYEDEFSGPTRVTLNGKSVVFETDSPVKGGSHTK